MTTCGTGAARQRGGHNAANRPKSSKNTNTLTHTKHKHTSFTHTHSSSTLTASDGGGSAVGVDSGLSERGRCECVCLSLSIHLYTCVCVSARVRFQRRVAFSALLLFCCYYAVVAVPLQYSRKVYAQCIHGSAGTADVFCGIYIWYALCQSRFVLCMYVYIHAYTPRNIQRVRHRKREGVRKKYKPKTYGAHTIIHTHTNVCVYACVHMLFRCKHHCCCCCYCYCCCCTCFILFNSTTNTRKKR